LGRLLPFTREGSTVITPGGEGQQSATFRPFAQQENGPEGAAYL
jgi:hypothetical protein